MPNNIIVAFSHIQMFEYFLIQMLTAVMTFEFKVLTVHLKNVGNILSRYELVMVHERPHRKEHFLQKEFNRQTQTLVLL